MFRAGLVVVLKKSERRKCQLEQRSKRDARHLARNGTSLPFWKGTVASDLAEDGICQGPRAERQQSSARARMTSVWEIDSIRLLDKISGFRRAPAGTEQTG